MYVAYYYYGHIAKGSPVIIQLSGKQISILKYYNRGALL